MASIQVIRFAGGVLRPILKKWSKRRLPQVNGIIHLNGLKSALTIGRDRWGIPTLKGKSRHDLFFAQGFVHAQDRLWQMDINRRTATGRLSEALGPEALDTDRLTRTLGFRRNAQAIWANSSSLIRRDIGAYCAGINAYLEQQRPLPLEFAILGYKPEAWQPTDSVSFGQLLAWTLSSGWAAELTRARLIQAIGQEKAEMLEPIYPERNPVTLPQGIEYNNLEVDSMIKQAGGPYLSRGFEGAGRGSNGWVISGARSTTGRPILCNDMHLPVPTPSLWYFIRLLVQEDPQEEPELDVSGVSQPGLPYVLIGHNRHIAWGATLTLADTEDLFIERIRGDDPYQYEFDGGWLPAEITDEEIKIKGRSNHLERVITTHHGPIISSILQPSDRTSFSPWEDASSSAEVAADVRTRGEIRSADGHLVLALKSFALEKDISFDGFALLNLSANWDDFVNSVREMKSPSLNLLYADVAGNIGYYMSGRVPIRAKSQGLIPEPGWTGDNEWIGHVPFEQMPHALNPDSGIIVTANNKIIKDDYPFYLGSSWRNGYRAARIEEMLSNQDRISPEMCQDIQMDMYSIPGVELVQLLKGLELECESTSEAIHLLSEWDGYLDVDSAAGTVYQVLLGELSKLILGPHLDGRMLQEFLGAGPHPVLVPINELSGHWTSTLLDLLKGRRELQDIAGNSIEEVVCQALINTNKELVGLLGEDPGEWAWGRLHQLTFHHAFTVRHILGNVFSHGPFPIGGDADTIHQIAVDPSGTFHDNAVSPSYRQIINLGDLASSKAMFAPGQSGHLGSRHYGDLIAPWMKGEFFPMDSSSSDGRPDAALILTPLPDEEI